MRWAVCAFLLVAAAARSETLPAELGLSGSVRTGYWSSNRSLDDRTNFTPSSVWLKTAPKFGDGWYAQGEGWILDERPLAQGRLRGEIREGYVGWRNDTVEVTLGRRIIAWGRGDRINPTDLITTRDYTRLFVQDDDQRRGSMMATASYGFGDTKAEFMWLPEFRPNQYPVPHVAGLSVQQGADKLQADQFGFRVDHIGSGVDWSASYLYGLNRNPGSTVSQLSASGLAISAVYNRFQMWGADFATNLGSYGTRGEVAYIQPGSSKGNIFNPRPYVQVVLGADRNVTEAVNINVQYMMLQVFSFADPTAGLNPAVAAVATETALLNNQRRRFQHGPAVRVAYTTMNNTLVLETSALAFISDGSFTVRPRATYSINDKVQLVAGADVFTGSKDSFFGFLRRNTTFLSELRYGF